MRVASDYDGTYDSHPELQGEIDFIITGNTWERYDHVMQYAEAIPVYFNPGKDELMEVINHKANVINKQKVDTFYENQKIQADLLKVLCPTCKVVLVK